MRFKYFMFGFICSLSLLLLNNSYLSYLHKKMWFQIGFISQVQIRDDQINTITPWIYGNYIENCSKRNSTETCLINTFDNMDNKISEEYDLNIKLTKKKKDNKIKLSKLLMEHIWSSIF